MAQKPVARTGETIRTVPMDDLMAERYLAYALSTIKSRSLPDVRDGLKPVHRRILWAMLVLRLYYKDQPKKCARVVGDVIGKYHPHGDSSVYDALVRLAQDFSSRYPLVDGQGNFGNIDGDSAAAMRYTEARLTPLGEALMEGLSDDAVSFKPTYDGQEEEPEVMPALFPNILANGSSGIAVGMATSIPPFNLGELAQAMLLVLRDKDKGHGKSLMDQIYRKMPGPDFPTGGVMVEPSTSIQEAYATGRGGFRLRARWRVEERPKGAWTVLVEEIPYMVQKTKLMESLSDLMEEKKLPDIEDIQDESTDKVSIRITPRVRTIVPEVMMERLFRLSDLENRFPLNLNVLNAQRVPGVMSIQQVLVAFLDHRREVLVRRTRNRLKHIAEELELIEAQQVVFLNLDEVIRIVREEDDAKPVLIATFTLTDRQAEYVLNTRLRTLRRIDEIELKARKVLLLAEQADLNTVLASSEIQDQRLADQIRAFVKNFEKDPSWPRRTTITDAPSIDMTEAVEQVTAEPITVICSRSGWVRAAKGHLANGDGLTFKEGDALGFLMHAQTTDSITYLMSNGRTYTQPANSLQMKGVGDPMRITFEVEAGAEIVSMIPLQDGEQGEFLLLSTDGYGFRIDAQNLLASRKAGRLVMPLADGAKVRALEPIEPDMDMVAITTQKGKLLCFPLNQIPSAVKARGVVIDKNGAFIDILMFAKSKGLATQDSAGRRRSVEDWTRWMGSRSNSGLLPPKGFPRSLRFVSE